MEPYVVSSRKYRPGTFATVVGQQHITGTLKNAIRAGQLAQAFLFCGPRGVGKTTCARILAKAINCLQPDADCEPCNACESCVSFSRSQSFNIYELDAASNNSVEDIRSLVEQVRYAPQGARYKVYIIDEVHMLSTAAFNAFLKTLEEPPPYAIFILATTERHKILPTILSRCQTFNFNRISIDDSVEHLKQICEKEGLQAEDEALHLISRRADGALRDALTMLDQMVSFAGKSITYKAVADNLNVLDHDYYFRLTDALTGEDVAAALNIYNDIYTNGFDSHVFLGGLGEHLRNLLVARTPATAGLLELPATLASRTLQQAAPLQTAWILNALNLLNQADTRYKEARNQRLHVELLLIKLCHLLKLVNYQPTTASSHAPVQAFKKVTQTIATEPAVSYDKAVPLPALPKTKLNLGISKEDILKQQKQKRDAALPAATSPEPETMAAEEPDPCGFENLNVGKMVASFKEKLAAANKKMLMTVIDRFEFVKADNEVLEVRLEGSHNAALIEEERQSLLAHVRFLCGVRPELKITVLEPSEGKPVYFTPEEKFKKMLEDYPVFKELAKQLEIRPE